jgi:hypothetical protein
VNEKSEARWGSPVHPSYSVNVHQPPDPLQDVPHDPLLLGGSDAHLAVVPEGGPVRPLKQEAQLAVDDGEAHQGNDAGRPALDVVCRLQQIDRLAVSTRTRMSELGEAQKKEESKSTKFWAYKARKEPSLWS